MEWDLLLYTLLQNYTFVILNHMSILLMQNKILKTKKMSSISACDKNEQANKWVSFDF